MNSRASSAPPGPRRRRGARPAGLLACSAAAWALLALFAAACLAGENVVLSWPETRRAIADGERVTVGEFFGLGSGVIPCQAYASGTLAVNGEPADEVSGTTDAPWEECGTTSVAGAFTRVQLSGAGIVGVAVPPLRITRPGACVYALGRVSGSGALAGSRASFSVSGQAALRRPAPAGCEPELPFDGGIGLFGPQSGGVGLLIWRLEHAAPVAGALAALERYWADIGAHDFAGAYAYLAPHAVAVGERAFAAAERRTEIRRVSFHGRLTGHGRRTAGGEGASVRVLSLVTRDALFGCRVWSGSYQMVGVHGSWRIARALLSPRPCAGAASRAGVAR